MRHREATDEARELAALHALGALDATEAVGFEAHLADGCRACEAEVRAFRAVATQLAHAVPTAAPRPAVRDRLLAYARAWDRREFSVIRATEGDWEPWNAEGAMAKVLFRDPEEGRLTALVRVGRGARLPSHRHADTEELYLLEGDLTVEGHRLGAGDYCAAPAGTAHGPMRSEGGSTFLLSASPRDQMTEGPADARGSAPASGLVVVRAGEGGWEPGPREGVARRRVFADRARRTKTYLVRMRPGSRLPGHRHATAEQFFMLDGDGHVTGQVLAPGDYYRAAPGTVHEETYTEGGCTFLVLASPSEAARG